MNPQTPLQDRVQTLHALGLRGEELRSHPLLSDLQHQQQQRETTVRSHVRRLPQTTGAGIFRPNPIQGLPRPPVRPLPHPPAYPPRPTGPQSILPYREPRPKPGVYRSNAVSTLG